MQEVSQDRQDTWWLNDNPLAEWITRITRQTAIDPATVARVMEAALASGMGINLPPPADGHYITCYVMYRRISTFFQHEKGKGHVLEISGDKGAIYRMFNADDIMYTATSFPEMNIENLAYPDHSFDYAICDQVIEHVPDPQKAVNEIRRVLKPNGWLFLTSAFLVQVHTHPDNVSDFWRFTPEGLL